MKAHIGVDTESKLIHSVAITSVRVHDSQVGGIDNESAFRGQPKAGFSLQNQPFSSSPPLNNPSSVKISD